MKFLLLLASLILASCAGVDIVVPEDGSLPPVKGNYDTLILKTSQDSEWQLGQTGITLEYGEDLREHSVSIFSPLGGVLVIYGYDCGADSTKVLSQGEIVTFSLDEIVEAQVDFCTISFRMDWDDIPNVDRPFEGQTGKLYVRLRDTGKTLASATWVPGGLEEQKGIAWGQFRALANPVGGINYVQGPDQVSEPIRLNVQSSESTKNGLYQLWSESKQIGIKSSPFTGRQVQLDRSQIIGAGRVQSYALAGFMVGEEGFRDDLWIGVNVFDFRIKKLGGKVTFTDTEVCYETEKAVALVALEETKELKNASDGCFPKPLGKSSMAFLTHIGRGAIAIIDPDKGEFKWKQ